MGLDMFLFRDWRGKKYFAVQAVFPIFVEGVVFAQAPVFEATVSHDLLRVGDGRAQGDPFLNLPAEFFGIGRGTPGAEDPGERHQQGEA